MIESHNKFSDATITVRASKAKALKKVIRGANLPKAVAKKIRWRSSGKYVTLTIRGAARHARSNPGDPKLEQIWTLGDLEMRPTWAWRIIRGMHRQHVKPVADQI
ncbi:MAG: hypothetical protein U0R51_12320 [Solirubrobacterales bacterium]